MLRLTRFSGAFDTLPAYELNSLLGHHAADALLARHDAGPPYPGVEGTVAVGAALGCEQPHTDQLPYVRIAVLAAGEPGALVLMELHLGISFTGRRFPLLV